MSLTEERIKKLWHIHIYTHPEADVGFLCEGDDGWREECVTVHVWAYFFRGK